MAAESSAILVDFLGYRFSTHFLMRFYIDFGSQNGLQIDQKSDFFIVIVAGSVFSGLKSLLKLIFASTAGPANIDFFNTLQCF